MHDWISDNLRATGEAATYQTCILPLPLLARRQGLVTVTCHPRNLEHVLRSRFENYPKGPQMQAAFHDLLGRGIFNSDGETWLIQRKTAALEFTTRTLRQAMARWTNRSIKDRLWRILADRCGDGKAVDLQDLLLRLTFDNICGLTFGKDPETLSPGLPHNAFTAAFDAATEATLQRLLFPGFFWRLKKALRLGSEQRLRKSLEVVDQHMATAIAERKLAPSDDLLSRFMKKRDADGNAFSSSVLQRIALNFLLAGRDTSSVALSWFFWTVMRRPDVEKKLVDEMTAVLTDTRGPDTATWLAEPMRFDELDRLVHLKAALQETLRLYPSVPQDTKYVVADDVLPDGTVVPAGSTVTYSIYSMGRMESIWGKDCREFRPERWLSAEGERFEPAKDPYQFVAFNGGPRTCLGKDLADLQMKSIASAVLLRYRLELVPGHRVQQKMSLTLFMKNGLRVYVRPRSHGDDARHPCSSQDQKVSDPFTPLPRRVGSRHKNEAFMAGETGLLHPFPAHTTRTLIFFISSAPLPFPIGSIRKAEADLELPSSVLQPTASATRPTMTMNRSPASLANVVCREVEQKRVIDFCKACIQQSKAGSLYVCGCPGTGKTLSIGKVQEHLLVWSKELPNLFSAGIANAIDLADRFLPKLESLNCEDANFTVFLPSLSLSLSLLNCFIPPVTIYNLLSLESLQSNRCLPFLVHDGKAEAIVSRSNSTLKDELEQDVDGKGEDEEAAHGFNMKSLLWHGGSAWDAWFSCASNQVLQCSISRIPTAGEHLPPFSLVRSSSISFPSRQLVLLLTLCSELAVLLVARGESETPTVLLLVGPDLTYTDKAGTFVMDGQYITICLNAISSDFFDSVLPKPVLSGVREDLPQRLLWLDSWSSCFGGTSLLMFTIRSTILFPIRTGFMLSLAFACGLIDGGTELPL
ncbi:unnamed protein product [Musa hybrid cultivar]